MGNWKCVGVTKLYMHGPQQIQGSHAGVSLQSGVLSRYGQSETGCQASGGATVCSDPWPGSRRGKDVQPWIWVWHNVAKKLWVNIAVSKSFKSSMCLLPVSISLSYLQLTSYPYEGNKGTYIFIKKCYAYSFIFIMIHHSSLCW